MFIALNIIILVALLSLLFLEEYKQRRGRVQNEETRTALLATAHQLRSPLANLKKFNTVLLSKQFGKLTFAQQEIVSKIHLSLSESLIGIDRLLARAHLEEAMLSDKPSVLNVRESMDAAVNAVRPRAENKKHTIVVDGSKHAHVFADVLLLHGIFNEVLLNAIAYTPVCGRIAVHIQERGDAVVVTISDEGIGIPRDEHLYVFQKFFRGKDARMVASGSGLGLWFVSESLQKMGGTISFLTGREKGTTFTITLPCAKEESKQAKAFKD